MKHTRVVLLVAAVLLLAACGRKLPDEPIPTQQPATPVSVQATDVDQPESTVEAAASDQQEPQVDANDPFAVRAAAANPTNGEQLFNQPNASGFACVNCHIANSDQTLVGPGLLGLPQHAVTRVADQTVPEYIYNSILHPGDFVVPNYPDMVMPRTYADVLTEDQVYDLVAYLLTLNIPDASTEQSTSVEPTPETQVASENAQVIVITTTPVIIVVTATPEAVQDTSSESPAAETQIVQAEPTTIGTPDVVVTLASFGFISGGETLFTTTLSDGSACSDCHYTDSTDEKNGGPALLGIPQRASQNSRGISPERYILQAIESTSVHANADYSTLLSASQRYDLVAYLMTLESDGSVVPAPQENQAADENAMISEAIANADAARGQELYNLPNATGFACSACHYPNTEDRLVGPGLLHIPTRAAERVAGESAEIYLYHSIMNPGAFVVPDYPDMVMPRTYAEVLSQQDIYDLVAYLLTLNE